MFDYYLQPLLEGFIFVIGIYLEKYIRKRIYPKKIYPNHDRQFKFKCRIFMMVLVTAILMAYNFYNKCQPYAIHPAQCFYLSSDRSWYHFLASIINPIAANLILFSYHLYERIQIKKNFSLQKLKDTKAIFWAPILQELLFRACFYRASQEKVSIFYLSLIFSVAHFHRFIWKKLINNKDYSFKQPLGQSVFTFIFGLYSFYFLSTYHSILSSIILHCMCNFFGPPSINKINLKYHIAAIVAFTLYLTLVVSN